ncbi:MAG: cytochrome c3 family protein [Phycisphaerales bacterium]|nr:cytochrome c3 family protein [Phycisphaerales bacterium]
MIREQSHAVPLDATVARSALRVLAMWASLCAPIAAQDRVSDTVHNLSASGPGRVRAVTESQICIFCHAPHNTAGLRPLWNRDLSIASYQIYQSSTLDAKPGQPTGSSKLCLSCHDGTIALGSVLSRAEQIRMAGGDFLPAGLANLGTDLSDDHPISFYYTAGIAASDRQLVTPSALPSEVRLDSTGQLQCTSCHDPHHNRYGQFLVKRREFGELCVACHQMTGWNASSHRLSNAPIVASPTADWPFATVSENACRSCHRSHSAGGHARLLMFEKEEDNCLGCHDGRIAHTNILAELDKLGSHDPRQYQGRHDPVEVQAGGNPHVECADCHNPHAVTAQPVSSTYDPIGATLVGSRGVTIAGAPIENAQYEYEVCFRCHGDTAVPIQDRILRQSQTDNLRLKFSPGNPSFHPVAMSSPSDETPSLAPGVARGSLMRCTDCHNNESGPRAGGGGPDGPHGSNFDFLLERNYGVLDNGSESEFEYAMCYKCHQRSSILGDQSFSEHRKHIVEERSPCSACHDPHGISSTLLAGSDHTHLINFDTTIVRPESRSGRIEYRDLGRFAGSCTLVCHGEQHRNEDYGDRR